MTKPIVLSLGELLWDMLPSGKRAGGAPVNFAYHAKMNGADGCINKADIVLCVIDGSTPLNPEEIEILTSVSGLNTIVLLNKSDVAQVVTDEHIKEHGTFTAIERISAKEGEGSAVLSKWVQELVYGGRVKQDNSAMISNVRHISLMEQAKTQVEEALSSIDMGMPVDFVATDLRSAWELLGDITGDTIRESMIDELFSRFCLGK